MKLTSKDKEFLNKLRKLLNERQLSIELKDDGLKRFRLRQNYGDHIEGQFEMTRQGVRWRFNHVFNEIYVEALMAVLMIESEFGTQLRHQAISIARERIELWQQAKKSMEFNSPRRETPAKSPQTRECELERDPPS